MVALILFIAFGLLFSYFATLNTASVTVNFGIYALSNIPQYILVLTSVGLGVIFASLFYAVKSISSKFILGQRNKELRDKNKEITDLTKELHELEIENAKLKSKSGSESVDEDSI
jgi:cell shape-determining protein MreC